MSDFSQLVRRLNQISTLETTTPSNNVIVAEESPDMAQTKNVLKRFNEIKNEVISESKVEEEFTKEDILGDIKNRFSDFLKAEANTAEVDDIRTVIDEASDEYEKADMTFSKVLDAINKIEKMIPKLQGMIEGAGVQQRAVTKGFEDVSEFLSQAYDNLTVLHYDTLGKSDPESEKGTE
jgi:methionine salvage enolase-phosphatase E1